jgi:putative colanic acid biosynthesis glycosyltransferase
MPSVLQICVEGNTGSTGRIAEGIGIAAIDRGWKSYIAYGRFPRPSQSSLIRIGSKWDIWAHGLQTRFLDRHCLASKNATSKLIMKIASLKPDIIHLHHLHGYYVNIELLFGFLSIAKIPVIWTFHDCWAMTGHCTYVDLARCDRWKTGCYSCPQRGEYPASLFLDRSRKNYLQKKDLFTSVNHMTIIPASNWLSGVVSESFLAKYPRRVIHNGIDLTVFKPTDMTPKVAGELKIGDKFMILGVANTWESKKGFQDFIRLGEVISKREIIVLVGLKRSVIKRLPQNIIGLEKTDSRQQLGALYGAAGVYVNPTWEDTFPTTNLEALACGTPVVTYKTGGSVEAISNETGCIVDQGDIAGLHRAIEMIESTGKDRFSIACRERAVKFFNKDERFAEYVDLYEDMMGASTLAGFGGARRV